MKYNRSSSSSEGFDESDIDEKKLASSHPKRYNINVVVDCGIYMSMFG